MNEPFDVFADLVNTQVGPYAGEINFGVSAPASPWLEYESTPPPEHLGTVRMSNTMLKALVIILRATIIQAEKLDDLRADPTHSLLDSLGLTYDQWCAFWEYEDD